MATVHSLAAAAAGLTVTVVAGETVERAARVAAETGARACTYADLPAGADAVVAAGPPGRHAELALQVARAGVPVLVEAPIARTLADADALVDAQRAGAELLYGENLLFAPVVTAAVALARREGAVRFVESRALSPRPTRSGPLHSGWGGGVLFELGVHPIALCLLLADGARPTEVRAELTTGEDPSDDGIDDDAVLKMRFASGLEARAEASWRHPAPVWDLQASGDTFVVRADLLPGIGLEHNGEPIEVAPPPPGVEPHLVELGYVDLLRGLQRDRSAARSPGAEFGRAVLEVVCAGYASAAAGGPVALPFTGPRDRSPFELWRS